MLRQKWQQMKLVVVSFLVVCLLLSGIPVAPLFPSQPAAIQTAEASTVNTPFSWDNATVYFVMIDRFFNGNTSNDNSYGRPRVDSKGKNIGTFHGGDVKGLTMKLKEGYFTDLGVNAMWITAPYEQIHGWVSGGSLGDFAHYAYHGYYPLDWTAIDKNIGTIEEFREFVDTAHSLGIRIVMDVVINHVGYGTLKDMATYGGFGGSDAIQYGADWEPPPGGSYSLMHGIVDYRSQGSWDGWWKDWVRAGLPGYTPAPPLSQDEIRGQLADLADIRTDLTTSVGLPPILRNKWNKEASGFTAWNLPKAAELRRDQNIAPGDYVIRWLAAWVEEFGIDGFRADTAKHVEMSRWKQLADEADRALKRWRANNPNKPGAKWTDDFWMTAEVFGLGMGKNSYHTNGGFDSTINFAFQGVPNNMAGIESTFSSYANQINNDGTWNVLNYISSHDTSLYDRNNLMNGGTALLLAPGAAQIYYGDETGRPFGDTGSDKDQGTRSSMNWNNYSTNLLTHWQKLGQFRNKHLAVGAGAHRKLGDGPYHFSRTYNKNGINDKVVVALGGSGQISLNVAGVFADGTKVRDFYTGREATVASGKVSIQAGTNGVTLLEEAGGVTPPPPPPPNKPATPTGLTSPSKTNTSVTLNWTAVSGATRYNIFRNNTKVGESTTTSFTNNGLVANTSYNFAVSAVNANSVESDRSAAISVRTNNTVTPPPPAPNAPPTNVDTNGQTKTSISLTWTAPANVQVKSYNVYRDGKRVGNTTTTRFNDVGLNADTDYTYIIRTVNNNNQESAPSNPALVVTTLPSNSGNVTSPIARDSITESNFRVIDLDMTKLQQQISKAEGVRIPYPVFDGGTTVPTDAPTVAAEPGTSTFSTEEVTITLSVANAPSGKYTTDGSDPQTDGQTFTNGQTITIGGALKSGESVTLKLFAEAGGKVANQSFTYTKDSGEPPPPPPPPPGGLKVHFKKPADWGTPQVYYYGTTPTTVPAVTWAASPSMTAGEEGWFTYEIPGATAATVIFKDSTSTRQIPAAQQPGFIRASEGWYDGATWSATKPTTSGGGVVPPPTPTSGLKLFFKKPADWGTPSVYFYGQQPATVNGVTWGTSPLMTAVAGQTDWFSYEILGATGATVIFKDSKSTKQIPAAQQPGFVRTADGWYNGTTWLTTSPFTTAALSSPTVRTLQVSNTVKKANATTEVTENVRFRIPYSAIQLLKAQSSGSILEIQMPNVKYDFHVDALDYEAINRRVAGTGTPGALADLMINVYFERMDTSKDLHAAFAVSLDRQQAEPMSDLFRFAVRATDKSNRVATVNELQNSLIARKIKLNGDEDTANMTGVMYIPSNGQTSHLPTTFETVDGVKYAVIYATHHPLVGLATAERSFVDITTHPAKADIEKMVSKLVMSGVDQTKFNPNGNLTRAQFATMLVRALGLPQDGPATSRFTDVRTADWHFGPVSTAVRYGLMGGRTSTGFAPNAPITREEMLVILSRVPTLVNQIVKNPVSITNAEVLTELRKFRDFSSNPSWMATWAQRPAALAVKMGILNPAQNNTLAPKTRATRGDAAMMIKRMLDYTLSIK